MYAMQIANLSESLAREYAAQGEKEKALQNFQKSLEIWKIICDEDCDETLRLTRQIENIKQ